MRAGGRDVRELNAMRSHEPAMTALKLAPYLPEVHIAMAENPLPAQPPEGPVSYQSVVRGPGAGRTRLGGGLDGTVGNASGRVAGGAGEEPGRFRARAEVGSLEGGAGGGDEGEHYGDEPVARGTACDGKSLSGEPAGERVSGGARRCGTVSAHDEKRKTAPSVIGPTVAGAGLQPPGGSRLTAAQSTGVVEPWSYHSRTCTQGRCMKAA